MRLPVLGLLVSVGLAGIPAQADDEIKRPSSGKPNRTGFYDIGSLTPLNRPAQFGDKQFMTREEADARMLRPSASY